MKDVTLKLEQLKKIDYPHTPPADAAEFIKVSPEMLLLSIAISTKRIADALEDGLTALTPAGDVLGLADIALKSAPVVVNNTGKVPPADIVGQKS